MSREMAATLARTLMDEHGLTTVPFEFDRAVKRLGATHFWKGGQILKITLSAHWVQVLSEDEVRDIVLHEIAHALTPYGEPSHGAKWRQTAVRVGATPVRCASPSPEVKARLHEDVAPAPWVGHCPKAGHVSYRYRTSKSLPSCGTCSRRYDPTNVIIWTPNR